MTDRYETGIILVGILSSYHSWVNHDYASNLRPPQIHVPSAPPSIQVTPVTPPPNYENVYPYNPEFSPNPYNQRLT